MIPRSRCLLCVPALCRRWYLTCFDAKEPGQQYALPRAAQVNWWVLLVTPPPYAHTVTHTQPPPPPYTAPIPRTHTTYPHHAPTRTPRTHKPITPEL